MDDDSKTTDLSNVIHIDDDRIQDHLGRVVRSTVEETLNALLDADALACTALVVAGCKRQRCAKSSLRQSSC